MALNDLGKVAMTFEGDYSDETIYERLTCVMGADGQAYVTTVSNVSGIEPGVTDGWENYWKLICMRGEKGVGIERIAKTGTNGTVDTYTIYYQDGSTWEYTVTNGQGIQSIVKTGTDGAVDTYTITFGNNQTATFTVTNARELAPGGTSGQVLAKKSDTDYDVEWKTLGGAATQGVADNLTTTVAGYVLDARQGKVLIDMVNGKASKTTTTASLEVASWSGSGPYTQTVSVSGVTASNTVVVAPAPESFTAWGESGVYASAQAAGNLTFTAAVKPTAALTANVLCIN